MNTTGVDDSGTHKGLTRRSWATLLAAAPLAAQAASTPQNPPPVSAPATATPEDKMSKAVQDVRKVSDRLAQTEVAMSIEPAICFRAL